jgi:hypothetical protein
VEVASEEFGMRVTHRAPEWFAITVLILLAALLMAIAPGTAQACPGSFSGGTGQSAETPYLISTRADLIELSQDPLCNQGAYFRQTADIDISGIAWNPIGRNAGFFSGTYDGGGHRITGLSLPNVSESFTGLFGVVQQSEIRNLTIVGALLTDGVSTSHIGVLAGRVESSIISNVHVVDATVALSRDEADVGALIGSSDTSSITGSSASGTVVAGDDIGGLVGDTCGTSITSSTANVAVTGSSFAGGLVGHARAECVGPTVVLACLVPCYTPSSIGIFDSQATGSVRGAIFVGGLVGWTWTPDDASVMLIQRSFATGAVEGDSAVGGLVGVGGDKATITDSYALGAVAGQNEVAGLIGALGGATVQRSYAVGRVTGDTDAGGLVGGVGVFSIPTFLDSFWDVATSGQAVSLDGTGKSTVEMKSLATFSAAGWSIAQGWVSDATKTWGICAGANAGYPYLLRQYTLATEPCTLVPGAPTALKATAGDGSVVVSWGVPASDGGSPVTSYTATALMQKRAAKSCTAVAPATTCTIAGLTNARAYKVSIVAVNRKGAGAAAVSGKVTPRSTMVVTSTRRSGLAVVSRARVSGAGSLTQVGTVVGSKQAVCRVATKAKAAGVVTLRCVLNRSAVRSLDTQSLRVRLITSFRSANGTVQSATRIVRFARVAAAPVVTG